MGAREDISRGEEGRSQEGRLDGPLLTTIVHGRQRYLDVPVYLKLKALLVNLRRLWGYPEVHFQIGYERVGLRRVRP